MPRFVPTLATTLLLNNGACVKKPPESPVSSETSIHSVGESLHEQVYYCLDHHVILPESSGLTVKIDIKGVPVGVNIRKDTEDTVIMAGTAEGLIDYPILDRGNDGIPDNMLYDDGTKKGWFTIGPKSAAAYQERYNFYLQAILDDGYCQEWLKALNK